MRLKGVFVKSNNVKKEWFTLKELSQMDLPGMSKSVATLNRRAHKEQWEYRQRKGGRGVSYEYHVSALPAHIQRLLLGASEDVGTTGSIAVDNSPEQDLSVVLRWLNKDDSAELLQAICNIGIQGVLNKIRTNNLNYNELLKDVEQKDLNEIIDALPMRNTLKNAIKIGLAGSEATDQEILRFIERHNASNNATQQTGAVSGERKKSAN
ncbi:hypothetical protein DSR35_05860 [Salmonella enterica subsp. enterica serovar Newport]|nr:hypothetical protein [Salmonella enterica subsp. enterica serovar Newport]EEF2894443.1 hypothetical protein [Salmonella enterica]